MPRLRQNIFLNFKLKGAPGDSFAAQLSSTSIENASEMSSKMMYVVVFTWLYCLREQNLWHSGYSTCERISRW